MTGIDDDVVRRDLIHGYVNSLPDLNYACLRALVLVSWSLTTLVALLTCYSAEQHLRRVMRHCATNRMNAGNLALIFG